MIKPWILFMPYNRHLDRGRGFWTLSRIKKLLSGTLPLLLITLIAGEVWAEKKIGVLMFSSEVRYEETQRGILDRLRERGFREPKTTFIVENAEANKAKAAELVKKFATAKFDLIITLGTSATVAATREIKDVPIVFSQVYDPVEAGIAGDWKSSGNNTTGTSTKLSMSKPLESLKKFVKVHKAAVLYSLGEKNSESQLRDLEKLQAYYGIRIIPVSVIKVEEIDQLLPDVLRTVDALYITGSNLVNSHLPKILDLAAKARVITLTHLEDLVEKGVLFGVCTSPYAIGQLAGEKAIKILKGMKPSAIPIEVGKNHNVVLNLKTAAKARLEIPPDFIKTVTKRIE